jgi:hypothetical protein
VGVNQSGVNQPGISAKLHASVEGDSSREALISTTDMVGPIARRCLELCEGRGPRRP